MAMPVRANKDKLNMGGERHRNISPVAPRWRCSGLRLALVNSCCGPTITAAHKLKRRLEFSRSRGRFYLVIQMRSDSSVFSCLSSCTRGSELFFFFFLENFKSLPANCFSPVWKLTRRKSNYESKSFGLLDESWPLCCVGMWIRYILFFVWWCQQNVLKCSRNRVVNF